MKITTCKYCKAKLKPVPLLDGVHYCENDKCEMNYAVNDVGVVIADERLTDQ
jgi:hypothetical protein